MITDDQYHLNILFTTTGSPGNAGVSYTRWGRRSCPAGTELVYEGAIAGSMWSQAGSSSYLCLHNEPEFLATQPGEQSERGKIYGTEYQTIDHPPAFSHKTHHDAPCAVCFNSLRSSAITIPGRVTCPSSWNREYYGYLMTEKYHTSHRPRAPICVDINPQSVSGSAGYAGTSLLYFIEAVCTGIKCPPYSNGAEIACVVCTK